MELPPDILKPLHKEAAMRTGLFFRILCPFLIILTLGTAAHGAETHVSPDEGTA